jgi:hypothetical protein
MGTATYAAEREAVSASSPGRPLESYIVNLTEVIYIGTVVDVRILPSGRSDR